MEIIESIVVGITVPIILHIVLHMLAWIGNELLDYIDHKLSDSVEPIDALQLREYEMYKVFNTSIVGKE